jgi:hypothetical protein
MIFRNGIKAESTIGHEEIDLQQDMNELEQ